MTWDPGWIRLFQPPTSPLLGYGKDPYGTSPYGSPSGWGVGEWGTEWTLVTASVVVWTKITGYDPSWVEVNG